MIGLLLFQVAVMLSLPQSIGDWQPVYDQSGKLLMLRWEDASGNLHVRFPLDRFAVVPEARVWTPARTPSGEYCWAIRTDEYIQTWQSRESRGRKFRSTEEFVAQEGMRPQMKNYGLVHDRVIESAKKAQQNKITNHGNGPKSPEEYDRQMQEYQAVQDRITRSNWELIVACVLFISLAIYRLLTSRT